MLEHVFVIRAYLFSIAIYHYKKNTNRRRFFYRRQKRVYPTFLKHRLKYRLGDVFRQMSVKKTFSRRFKKPSAKFSIFPSPKNNSLPFLKIITDVLQKCRKKSSLGDVLKTVA